MSKRKKKDAEELMFSSFGLGLLVATIFWVVVEILAKVTS